MIKLKALLFEVVDLPPSQVKFEMPAQAQSKSSPHFVATNHDFAQKTSSSTAIDYKKLEDIIKRFENNKESKSGGWNKSVQKWFPHKSLEGGSPTIAYGHKIVTGEDFSKGLTDVEAINLLRKDIQRSESIAKGLIKNWNTLPSDYKIAIINSVFRGGRNKDIGPKAIEYINKGEFEKVPDEYLNHREYKTTNNKGVKDRMGWNANIFKKYANVL